MKNSILFNKKALGTFEANNRIVLAPMTRSRTAQPDDIPTDLMAKYYAQRASAGFIITEATQISSQGKGYSFTPGMFTAEQVAGWRKVTQAVHKEKGHIVSQLWHVGRMSHASFHADGLPVAPSAIAPDAQVWVVGDDGIGRMVDCPVPRALSKQDIKDIIQDYRHAAKNAMEAGFDGIEIHGANSYLIDEFLHWDTNRREDEYGGTVENMSRFLLEIIDQIKAVIPENKIGLRLSPQAYINLEHDDRDKQVFDYLLPLLNKYDLAYVHTGMFNDAPYEHLQGTVTQYIRKHYRGTVIASGGYTAESANSLIENGDADLVAIGRPFIANPDYVEKVKQSKELTEYSDSMLAELY